MELEQRSSCANSIESDCLLIGGRAMSMCALMNSVSKRASSVFRRTERHPDHRSATDRVARLHLQVTRPQRTSAASASNYTTAQRRAHELHERTRGRATQQQKTSSQCSGSATAAGSFDSSKDTFAGAATGNAAQSTSSSTTSQKTPRHTVSMLLKALNEMGLVACTGLVRSDSLDDIKKLKAEVCE